MSRMGIVNMSSISCIVFDECHHTCYDHPFNIIMKEFYFTQSNRAKLPYIIGTTASPIVENNKKDIDTVL